MAAAETLPAGMERVLDTAGILDEIADAGFYPNHGETRWWVTADAEIENYPAGTRAWHVDRQRFDGLLLLLAEHAGAIVRRNSRVPRVALDTGIVEHEGGVTKARFVIDASGRAGLLVRQIRRYWDPRYRTTALCAFLRANRPWDVDPHHTLIEAYENGWAWSVPLAPNRRHVCFLVETASIREGAAQAYGAQLERAPRFHELFADSALEGLPWMRDASLYYAERYAGPNWLLVGDAASFSDPVCSHGIEEALLCASVGAGVVSTALNQPDRAAAAIEMYQAMQAERWLEHARKASCSFAECAATFGTDFWRDRAQQPDVAGIAQP